MVNKYVVMVKYRDGEVDCLSVWDSDQIAHQERYSLSICYPGNRYWVREARYNKPYIVN